MPGISREIVWISACWLLAGLASPSLAAINEDVGNATAGTRSSRRSDVQYNAYRNFMTMIFEHYDETQRPAGLSDGDAAVLVRVNMLIRSITKIDESMMEYSAQVTFRQEWTDSRLAYQDKGNYDFLVISDPERIWKPDVFFQNECSSHLHNLPAPNVLVRLHPNGSLLMSMRLSLTLGCSMDFRFYPMDRQTCEIRIASYGYTATDLKFFWKDIASPVQLANLSMPRFRLEGLKTGYCSSVTATGTYSCLRAVLFMERGFSYYLTKVYMPSILIIAVSWISFCLEPEAVAGRSLLLGSAFLSMIAVFWNSSDNIPALPYTTAMEVWTMTCFLFIFGALIEFAFMNHFSQTEQRKIRKRSRYTSSTYETETELLERGGVLNSRRDLERDGKHRTVEFEVQPETCCFGLLRKPLKRSEKVDTFARWVFPCVFTLFNMIYWIVCLGKSYEPLITCRKTLQ